VRSVGRIIYLHLGLPKTGTTTIQSALASRRKALREQGFLYPGFAENHSVALRSVFAAEPHRLAMNRLRGAGTAEAAAAKVGQWSGALDKALASPDWTSLVLSAEGAVLLTPDGMGRLRDRLLGHADRVIVPLCLRHPYRHRVSRVQQGLKTGDTIDAAVRRLAVTGYLRETIGRLGDVFGADNLRPAVFEEMIAHPGGLTEAFAAMIGLPPGQLPESAARRMNQRMSQRACLVLDRLNREVPLLAGAGRSPGRSRRVDAWVRGLPGPDFALTPEQAEALRSAVEDDLAFAAALFGRQVWTEEMPARVAPPAAVGSIGMITRVARIAGRVLP
jgi:hypothetical protein